MSRLKTPVRKVQPDAIYNSTVVEKFICRMMLDGKKSTSSKILYSALDAIAEKTGESKEAGLKQLLRYWSLMHGAISLLISPNVELPGNTENYLKDFF